MVLPYPLSSLRNRLLLRNQKLLPAAALAPAISSSQPAAAPPVSNIASAPPGVFKPVPKHARYMFFRLRTDSDPLKVLEHLCTVVDPETCVVGLGSSLLSRLDKSIAGMREHPALQGKHGVAVPSTPFALWLFVRGEDQGDVVLLSHALAQVLEPAFQADKTVDAFRHGSGRDLTGFEDGTENPKTAAAMDAAAFVRGEAGFGGSSFVAVEQWVHDLRKFQGMAAAAQDEAIGRRKLDNAELPGAPPSAHILRTQQESFSPEGFVLRRSMPWADGAEAGLMFVAFGKSFDAFEAQLRRMVGLEDGVTDALFQFTRPVSGSFFWVPPVTEDGRRLDLRALGLYW